MKNLLNEGKRPTLIGETFANLANFKPNRESLSRETQS